MRQRLQVTQHLLVLNMRFNDALQAKNKYVCVFKVKFMINNVMPHAIVSKEQIATAV